MDQLFEHGLQANSFLERSPADCLTADQIGSDHEFIDFYNRSLCKVREQIGEGGMGAVYVAEQMEPVAAQGCTEDHQAGHGDQGCCGSF